MVFTVESRGWTRATRILGVFWEGYKKRPTPIFFAGHGADTLVAVHATRRRCAISRVSSSSGWSGASECPAWCPVSSLSAEHPEQLRLRGVDHLEQLRLLLLVEPARGRRPLAQRGHRSA